MVPSSQPTSLRAIACAVWMLAVVAYPIAQDSASLQYQSRGNRSEGLRTILVSGYDIELLSARIEPTADANAKPASKGWADSVRLRFYLPDEDKVFITVRQLRSRTTYYWLNNVTSAFQTRAVNEYDWPTAPVLRRLPELKLDELGATVRIGQEQPAKSERVLPAIMSDAPAGDTVEAYRFLFKTNGRASVTAAIYSGERKVHERPRNVEDANSPFTVRWPADSAPEGWYRLVVSGYFTSNNTPLDKEVRFYHRPSLQR